VLDLYNVKAALFFIFVDIVLAGCDVDVHAVDDINDD